MCLLVTLDLCISFGGQVGNMFARYAIDPIQEDTLWLRWSL